MQKIKLNVEGIKCSGCETRIQNALLMLDGVSKVEASSKEGTVTIEMADDTKMQEIVQLIENLGFDVLDDPT